MDGNRTTLIIGALTSGFLCVVVGVIAPCLLFIAPGVLFAMFVAIPWVAMCGRSLGDAWGMAALCILGYCVAVLMFSRSAPWLAPLGAGVGTFIMLAPALFSESENVRRGAGTAIATGILAASVFTGVLLFDEGWWWLLGGIAFWQVAVAVALGTAFSNVKNVAKLENGPL